MYIPTMLTTFKWCSTIAILFAITALAQTDDNDPDTLTAEPNNLPNNASDINPIETVDNTKNTEDGAWENTKEDVAEKLGDLISSMQQLRSTEDGTDDDPLDATLEDDASQADDVASGIFGLNQSPELRPGSFRTHGAALEGPEHFTIVLESGDAAVIESQRTLGGDLIRGTYFVTIRGESAPFPPTEDLLEQVAVGDASCASLESSGVEIRARVPRTDVDVLRSGRGVLADEGECLDVLCSWMGEIRISGSAVEDEDFVEMEFVNARSDQRPVTVTVGIAVGPSEDGFGRVKSGDDDVGEETDVILPRSASSGVQALHDSAFVISKHLEAAFAELQILRSRLSRHIETQRSTNDRVFLAGVAGSVAVIVVLVIQAWSIQNVISWTISDLGILPLRSTSRTSKRTPFPVADTPAAHRRWQTP